MWRFAQGITGQAARSLSYPSADHDYCPVARDQSSPLCEDEDVAEVCVQEEEVGRDTRDLVAGVDEMGLWPDATSFVLAQQRRRNAYFALLAAMVVVVLATMPGGLRARGADSVGLEDKSLVAPVPRLRRHGGHRGGHRDRGGGRNSSRSSHNSSHNRSLNGSHSKRPRKACPGSFHIDGVGRASLVQAAWNKPRDEAGGVQLGAHDGALLPGMKSRAYFASSCNTSGGDFHRDEYLSLKLLGKTLRYTVDLSGAGCGCNAALYLTALPHSREPSKCEDYYCDASKVCGVTCAEIDIQEANSLAWFSTVHSEDDGIGFGDGYGAGRHAWNASEYGPNGTCIDTGRPFQVSASFLRMNKTSGPLAAFEVSLSQDDHKQPCALAVRIDRYAPLGRSGGMEELGEALEGGMTPVISYWGVGEDLSWMDGRGPDGKGPCAAESPAACAESVSFSSFSVA